MSLDTYLSNYSGTLNDKELAFLKAQLPGVNGTINDLWLAYLTSIGYTGALNDMMLEWARATGGLPGASLGDALGALPAGGGQSYAGASLVLDFINHRYQVGAPNVFPTYVTFASLISTPRASVATHYDQTGKLVTVGNNIARLDYNPLTKERRGLLVEEVRTNNVPFSEDFSSWSTVNNATVTPNTHVSPDGTQNADSVLLNAAGSYIRSNSLTSTNAGGSQIGSIYARRNSGAFSLRIGKSDLTAYFRARIDTATRTITPQSGLGGNSPTVGVQRINDDWDRYWMWGNVGTAETTTVLFLFKDAADVSATPNVVFGAQFETGPFVTSYIPTAAAIVTRAGEAPAVNAPLTPWYSGTAEGTIAIHFNQEFNGIGSGGNIRRLLALHATAANYVEMSRNNTNAAVGGQVMSASVGQNAFAGVPVPALGVNVKAAIAWKLDDAAFAAQGQPSQTDNVSAIPAAAPTALAIGWRTGIPAAIGGWVQRVEYYPRRLPNAQLQGITA